VKLLNRAKLCFLLLCMLVARPACGFVFLGPGKPHLKPVDGRNQEFHLTTTVPVFADKDTFDDGVYADRSDSETFALLILRAMASWNEIPGLSVQLRLADVQDGTIDPDDNKFSIGVGKITTVASGLAFPQVDSVDDSKIRDCDIQVGTDITSIPSFIFVMIHELGHCLGLGHNHSDPSAIMGYWMPRKEIILGLDDMAGALALYPTKTGDKTVAFAPCGDLALAGSLPISGENKIRPQDRLKRARASGWWIMFLAPAFGFLLAVIKPWSFRRRQQVFVR